MAQEVYSKITESLLNSGKNPAFIPFIVSGFPNISTTKDLLYLLQQKGAAAIELGVPFSDPLADGPVIQNAANHALKEGVNLNTIFDLLNDIKTDFKTPIIIFSYFNPILSYGLNNFVEKAKNANVSGVIIPDLPIEESAEFQDLCRKNGIDFIMLVAPTSGEDRIKKISEKSHGFIYLVSSTGVTGVRDTFSSILEEIKDDIRKYSEVPIAIGFGVSKPEHIKELRQLKVDGAIIGSAIIKIIDKYKSDKSLLLSKLSDYINELYERN